VTARKIYLGDAVYADFDDDYLVLTTENGYEATNTIYLEPEVWRALKEYMVASEKIPEVRLEDISPNDKVKRGDIIVTGRGERTRVV